METDFYVFLDGKQAHFDKETGIYYFKNVIENKFLNPQIEWRAAMVHLIVPGLEVITNQCYIDALVLSHDQETVVAQERFTFDDETTIYSPTQFAVSVNAIFNSEKFKTFFDPGTGSIVKLAYDTAKEKFSLTLLFKSDSPFGFRTKCK